MITKIDVIFRDGSREYFNYVHKDQYGKELRLTYTRSETTVTIIEHLVEINETVEHVFERADIRKIAIKQRQEA